MTLTFSYLKAFDGSRLTSELSSDGLVCKMSPDPCFPHTHTCAPLLSVVSPSALPQKYPCRHPCCSANQNVICPAKMPVQIVIFVKHFLTPSATSEQTVFSKWPDNKYFRFRGPLVVCYIFFFAYFYNSLKTQTPFLDLQFATPV